MSKLSKRINKQVRSSEYVVRAVYRVERLASKLIGLTHRDLYHLTLAYGFLEGASDVQDARATESID